MMNLRRIAGMLLAALLLTGCAGKPSQPDESSAAVQSTEPRTETTAPPETTTAETTTTVPAEPYAFNPHVYAPMFDGVFPHEYWDAFHNLCDALREGKTTFACADKAAYRWATDVGVLLRLFPAACAVVQRGGENGKTFENGVGTIRYTMPAEDFVKREAEFEEIIVNTLNRVLEPDDDDFEKCLKLYRYIASEFQYEDPPDDWEEGVIYYTFLTKKGVCGQLAGVYSYLLLQVGVDTTTLACYGPKMCHAWSYVVIDGRGYHSDPTWGLMSDCEGAKLPLNYFLMTDEQRIQDGCSLDEDLSVDLIMSFWVNESALDLSATDSRFSLSDYPQLESIDEKNKIIHYTDLYGEAHELYYGKQ